MKIKPLILLFFILISNEAISQYDYTNAPTALYNIYKADSGSKLILDHFIVEAMKIKNENGFVDIGLLAEAMKLYVVSSEETSKDASALITKMKDHYRVIGEQRVKRKVHYVNITEVQRFSRTLTNGVVKFKYGITWFNPLNGKYETGSPDDFVKYLYFKKL